ncbi:MAG: hypothetical protein KGL02_15175, partial [Acidobacteriota bacterium]|nr:hypothetical protein [Acidobacteriota bacterium]
LLIAAPLLAQSAATRNIPAGWIDGSVNPSLIPDRTAYRLVFISLTLPASPSQHDLARQKAHLLQIGLSSADQTTLIQAVATFATSYSAWQQAPGHTDDQAWTIVQNTRSALQAQLTGDGNSKFSAYVALAKTHMIAKP